MRGLVVVVLLALVTGACGSAKTSNHQTGPGRRHPSGRPRHGRRRAAGGRDRPRRGPAAGDAPPADRRGGVPAGAVARRGRHGSGVGLPRVSRQLHNRRHALQRRHRGHRRRGRDRARHRQRQRDPRSRHGRRRHLLVDAGGRLPGARQGEKCPDTQLMSATITQGSCSKNGCHTSTQQAHLP